MNKAKKLLALSLSALLSLSVFAGCNGSDNKNDSDDTPNTGTETPETPDKQAPVFSDGQATVKLSDKIYKKIEEKSVSSDLFGLFLEDINYASQALDDELIANGSFESTTQKSNNDHKYAWTAGNGLSMTCETGEKMLHENSPYYAKVSTSAGGTLSNKGFDAVPMYIQSNKNYLFSAFLRGYNGEITVKAKAGSETYAEKNFSVNAPDDRWIKVEQTLTATKTGREGVSFEISFGAEDNEVLLDGVQFETLDSTAGIKNYMYRAIADLSPAFFRFPGGCVIEGKDMNSAYDWKNSVGAVKTDGDDKIPAFTYTLYKDGEESEATTYGEWVTRIPNGNIWQPGGRYYPHEYGIGFYEYFLLCDNLGAKAIPIVNCGLSCQTQTPNGAIALSGRYGKGITDYIQDAIDLIEFAKGDESTEWGKIRAQMGHPEPFEMDYIGVGNEQWDKYYSDYYEKFLQDKSFKAALEKYNVKTIVGNCTMFEHCENPARNSKGAAQNAAIAARNKGIVEKISDYGVVDQHYYVNFTDFLQSTTLYDNYTRPIDDPDNYYEVFVGEYAVNSDVVRAPVSNEGLQFKQAQNSMLTALAEAAMMTGFERNGDIVKLAAYAPMFGTQNTGNRQWQVDMMYFDNEYVVLTPNYYVQQLFMKNTGDYKVAAELTYAEGVTAPKTTYQAFASPQTRECDDIFYVASCDEETGDVIVKLVNAGGTSLKVNVDFAIEGLSVKGIADVWELSADDKDAVNTADDEPVRPKKYKIGIEGSSFGYELLPYSVTAIRIRTK